MEAPPVLQPTVMPLFRLKDECGMPFDITALMCRERGLAPDWLEFFIGACAANWKRDKIQHSLEEIAGVFGWMSNATFLERSKECWELAAIRTGWNDHSWLKGRKTPEIIKSQ